MARECPITREEWNESAPNLRLQLSTTNSEGAVAEVVTLPDEEPREFSSDAMGWYVNGKVQLTIAGKRCWVQVGARFTLIGSKRVD